MSNATALSVRGGSLRCRTTDRSFWFGLDVPATGIRLALPANLWMLTPKLPPLQQAGAADSSWWCGCWGCNYEVSKARRGRPLWW